MKKLLCSLLLMMGLAANAADQTVYLYVIATNASGTVSGDTLTVNGDTRRATNNISGTLATTFLTTNTAAHAATNLYRHLATYYFAGPMSVRMTNATTIELAGVLNQTISFSIGGTWGRGILATSVNVRAEAVMVPYYDVPGQTMTNWADGLLDLLSDHADTNFLSQSSRAAVQLVGTNNVQTVRNKTIADSSTTNTVHSGTIGLLSAGVVASTVVSNATLKKSTLTDTSVIEKVSIFEGNWIRLDGESGTNFLTPSGLGSLYLMVPGMVNAFTNPNPAQAEIINYGTMRALFPLLSFGITNWWASQHNFTNAAEFIRFWHGFHATNPVVRGGLFISVTNIGPLRFRGTNFTTGGDFTKDVILIGEGVRIGGSAGDTDGNMVIGYGITASSETSPPFMAVGRGLLITNGGKFAMGFDGVKATNAGAYSFFGSASEDNEFRIGDASVHAFVRPGPAIKNLNTLTESTNVFRGDVSFPAKSISSLANGTNVIASATNVIVSLDGSISADSWLAGWQGGRDGKWHKVYNNSGFNIALLHESGLAPTTGDRFRCLRSRDAVIASGGSAMVWYSSAASRWIVENVYPEAAGLTLSASLTVDNTTLSCTNVTYYRVTSNSGVATDRTIVLTPGTYVGQELTIESVGANAWELADDSANTGGGNNRLNTTFTAGQYDLLELKFNGTDWLERSRSAN